MGVYPASDGLINIAASSGKMWGNFCAALNANHLSEDPAFKTGRDRVENREALNKAVGVVTSTFTVQALVDKLNPVGVPCGPIYNIGEAFEDAQAQHLRMTRPAPHSSLGDINLVRSPINLSANPAPAAFHHAGPTPGQHTDEVLMEFGLSQEDIDKLREDGAIG